MSSPNSKNWRDERREWMRYLETLAADHYRRREAKELAHRELRDMRQYDARLRKVILAVD